MGVNNVLTVVHPELYGTDMPDRARSYFESYSEENPIAPSDRFAVRSLLAFPDHSWMGACKFTCVAKSMPNDDYGVDVCVVPDLGAFYEEIDPKLRVVDQDVVPWADGPRKLIALDTETTGLDMVCQIVGGKPVFRDKLVGVCVGINSYEGFYLPVMNTQADGVQNWSMEEIRGFLMRLTKGPYHTLWFNADFDFRVLWSIGVPVDKVHYSDLMVISRLSGNYEFYNLLMKRNSLKLNSEALLGRKMLTLAEILNLRKKEEHVNFSRLSAVGGTVYGASDGINTYALFDHQVLSNKDGRNPYKHQSMASEIAMRTVYHTASMTLQGVPFDYEYAKKRVKTLVRRSLLVETKLKSLWGNILLSSQNRSGRWLTSCFGLSGRVRTKLWINICWTVLGWSPPGGYSRRRG